MSNHFKTRLNTPIPTAHAESLAKLSAIDDGSLELAMTICQAADERKGANISLLRVADVCYLADYFVIITGFSNVQVRAIARFIQDTIEDNWQRKPEQVEGMSEGRWVLLDYGEVIVHIFLPQEREFYNLEAFWGHAERIEVFASES